MLTAADCPDTAEDLTPGAWVRFPRHDSWKWVRAARHGSGFVQYDACDRPGGPFTLGGFAPHAERCRIVSVTPEAVAS